MATVQNHFSEQNSAQIHFYGGPQSNSTDHIENLDFGLITGYQKGHHGRSGGGSDTYNFTGLSNVSGTVVGRLEDIDFSTGRDKIQIEGVDLDLNNLSSNVRIVEYSGGFNDSNEVQQWLLINTASGGHIFYALEGARVDMDGNGGSAAGDQENHFLLESQLPQDFSSLTDVAFIDPENVVPSGFSPDGGSIVNDIDADAIDVSTEISGTGSGDLIAAGLNDDDVRGDGGDDTIEGGTGNDHLTGGSGNDDVSGGHGDDILSGWAGHDHLSGDDGDDLIYAQSGDDTLSGGAGNDKLVASSGNDILDGGDGQDELLGGSGTDLMTGGGGADQFVFKTGDLQGWDENIQDTSVLDVVTDFVLGEDLIVFDGYTGVSSRSDLSCARTTIDGNAYFVVNIRDTDERFLVDVADDVTWVNLFAGSDRDGNGISEFDENFLIL